MFTEFPRVYLLPFKVFHLQKEERNKKASANKLLQLRSMYTSKHVLTNAHRIHINAAMTKTLEQYMHSKTENIRKLR